MSLSASSVCGFAPSSLETTRIATSATVRPRLRIPLKAIRFRPETANGAGAGAAPVPAPAASSEAPAAYRVAGGELERVELRTGIRDERWAEVLDGGGLADGDLVVVAYPKAADGGEAKPAQSPFQRRFR